jgi:hypothetical protein
LCSYLLAFDYPSDPAVAAVRKKLNPAIDGYLSAVESSVDTAKKGITLAKNGICLLENFGKHEKAEVCKFMEEVGVISGIAHTQAEETYEKFKSVQFQFLQVSA